MILRLRWWIGAAMKSHAWARSCSARKPGPPGHVASFFYHPHLGTSYLKTIMPGLKQMGHAFVPTTVRP
jgi:hypothetical protein